MIGVRLNSFNDNSLGEPEQDANSALTELDKGLRSGKVGEQCEAIVRFPRLFEKYPFPILINSSFLKLADVFRLGNNFLRLWVLRVCQQSEKHLDKILNIDEFVRRVFSVLHSNDPVARALALQTLGAVAGIIPERQNVHHAIRCGLDSHDDVEVDAAIYATTQFAAQSNAFAVSMCNKLSDMVVCEATGAERRARLVRALRTVHGGAVRAHGVLRLLRALMARFPSASSVRAAIAAITAIAADTVVHVPDQVELLLNIAVSDARWGVRRSALFGLRRLAEHAALWPLSSAKALVDAATSEHTDNSHMLLCLEVLEILVRCPAVCAAAGAVDGDTQEAEALRRFCSDAALSRDLTIASTAATVLTSIAVHCYQESVPVQGASELLLSLESLVIITGVNDGKNNVKPLRRALKCLVQLCFASPTHLARTARVIGAQLKSSSWDGYSGPRATERRAVALLEALGALGGSVHCTQALGPAMPAVVGKLREAARVAAGRGGGEGMEVDGASSDQQEGTALALLCTVVCQERAGAGSNRGAWEAQVVAAIDGADGWTQYRVGRAALRYGHHNLASGIFSQLASLAPTEAVHRWLTALQRAATADAMLAQENGLEQLEAATAEYSRAAACVSGGAGGGGACAAGCGGCSACVPLAACYVRARAAQLAALARAAAAARALCTQPPPAIAHSQAQAARDVAARCGACAGAVRRAARALGDCRAAYARIARTAFDADDASLRHIHILQHTCNQLTQLMERITTSNYQERQSSELSFSTRPLQPTSLEDKLMLAVCDDITAISNKLFDSPDTKPGISHRHMEALLAAIRAACARPAGWPRAVAVRAPPTRCRLALTPAPRAALPAAAAEHAVPVPHGHHLALKIEGVIQPAPVCKGYKARPVQSVQLTVTAVPHPRNNDKGADIWSQPPILTAVQTVTPVRDFFSAQQLVAPGMAGLYAVAVQAAFVDDRGTVWNTGPRVAVNIKVHEDPTAKSTVQATRARF